MVSTNASATSVFGGSWRIAAMTARSTLPAHTIDATQAKLVSDLFRGEASCGFAETR
jgi:hypothetical protein